MSDEKKALQPGDSITYGVSALVRADGQEAWVKMDATTTVQPGEEPDEARYRLSDFVNEQLTDAIDEVKTT